MPERLRRVLVLRDFLPNRALVSSRGRTCCAPRNGLRRTRLTTEARRRRRFASGDDPVVPSTRREDKANFVCGWKQRPWIEPLMKQQLRRTSHFHAKIVLL